MEIADCMVAPWANVSLTLSVNLSHVTPSKPVPIVLWLECAFRKREVVGWILGHVINKTVDMVPVVTLLQGAQHYKASTGFSSIKI